MSTAPTETGLTVLPARPMELAVSDVVEQKRMIAECMQQVMTNGQHYGIVPGTSRKDDKGNELAKPCLFKPGAETLGFMFRLRADYHVVSAVEREDFIKYRVKCVLTHIGTGVRWGSALASCNSREEKYRRAAPKKCPKCGKETIIKGREEYGGGWVCFSKKGGCGQKFKDDAPEILDQPTGVADPSDLDNTILKMAEKRAHVAAILGATAASDFFTQDLEDLTEKAAEYTPPAQPRHAEEAAALDAKFKATMAEVPTGGGVSTAPATSPRAPLPPASPPPAGKPKVIKASDIPHEGVELTDGQRKKIFALKAACGGIFTGDDEDPQSYWRSKVLKVYRDEKGERLTSLTQMSKNQAAHLIDRMEGYAAKVKANADKGVDLGAIGGVPPEPDNVINLRDAMNERLRGADEDEFLMGLGFEAFEQIPKELNWDVLQVLLDPSKRDEVLEKWKVLGWR